MLSQACKYTRSLLSALFLTFAMATLLHSASVNAAPANVSQQESKVNINNATAAQIAEALRGVGLVKAEAIVQYRKSKGKFKSADDLTNVKGIGEATVNKNRTRIIL